MGGGSGEGNEEIALCLQWVCIALAHVAVELSTAALFTQSLPFRGDIQAHFEGILGNKQWAGLP